MIVVDASVVVELLTNGKSADAIRETLDALDEPIAAPHLLDVEVISAIRRLTAGRRLALNSADHLITNLAALPAERYSHAPLLGRVWELRHNFTANDATYIALAEALRAVLFTCDEKLGTGHRARVSVFRTPSIG